eukprot:3176017-Amphidinium_carterae.1
MEISYSTPLQVARALPQFMQNFEPAGKTLPHTHSLVLGGCRRSGACAKLYSDFRGCTSFPLASDPRSSETFTA